VLFIVFFCGWMSCGLQQRSCFALLVNIVKNVKTLHNQTNNSVCEYSNATEYFSATWVVPRKAQTGLELWPLWCWRSALWVELSGQLGAGHYMDWWIVPIDDGYTVYPFLKNWTTDIRFPPFSLACWTQVTSSDTCCI